MTFQVFKIDTYDIKGNTYGVGREESWIARKNKSFETEKEAKEYIRKQSLIHTDLINFLTKGMGILESKEKEDMIEKFCFTEDRFLLYRRFFLGYVPEKEIRRALKASNLTPKTKAF